MKLHNQYSVTVPVSNRYQYPTIKTFKSTNLKIFVGWGKTSIPNKRQLFQL